jgi:hypothetical protein
MREIVTIRPVTHTEDLLVPVPLQQYILDSDDKPTENWEKIGRGVVYSQNALTANVFDNNIQYLLCISAAVGVTNCAGFIVLEESDQCTELYLCSVWEKVTVNSL